MANLDFDKLYTDARATYELLRDESLWLRGSSEYDETKKRMEQDAAMWETLKKKKEENPNFKMSDYEIQMVNHLLDNTSMFIDTYLDNKEEEKKELEEKGKTLSKNSQARVDAMNRARKSINKQKEMLDNEINERMEEQPTGTAENIRNDARAIETDMAEAQKGVWFGSSEYNRAQKAFTQVADEWQGLQEDIQAGEGQEEKVPDPGTLQWMKSKVLVAQERTDSYLLLKDDDTAKEKTNRRKSVMGRSRDNMDQMLRKIAEWEKANEEKAIEYDSAQALEDTNTQLEEMRRANEGAFIGSSEYRTAMKAVEEQQKLWTKIQEKGEEYVPSVQEMLLLEEANNKAEKAIDSYLFEKGQMETIKAGRESDRLKAMQNAKSHVIQQKRILANRRKDLTREAEEKSYEDIGNEALAAETALSDANKKVYFGSRAYKNAMHLYRRTYNKWQDLAGNPEDEKLTVEEIREMKAQMREAQKAIEKYTIGKKDKNLDQHPKTRKRVESMEQAHRNLEIRIRKLDKMEKKLEGVANEAEKKQFNERVKNLHTDAKDKAGAEKNAARASLAATQKLTKLSQKQKFTVLDKKEARRGVAALVMEERMKTLPEETKKELRKSGAYVAAIKGIAESKEFKAALPDSKLTPLNCRQFAKNPVSVQKVTKDFEEKIVKAQNAKKEQKKQQEKKKELNNKKELTNKQEQPSLNA